MNEKSKYKYTEDGQLLVRKKVSETVLPGLYTEDHDMWFPCNRKNPDHHYVVMLLAGWFGLHKFQERSFLQGVFYLLTCGCFGVFYLCDLISMLGGTYCYWENEYLEKDGDIERRRKRIYYGPLRHRGRGVLLLIIGAFLVWAVVTFVYQPVGQAVLSWLGTIVEGRTAMSGSEWS